jgi:hypothetical protein
VERATFRAALLVLTCAALGAGCKKDQQSLLVASLKLRPGTAAATGLKLVTLTATPGSGETFLTMAGADGRARPAVDRTAAKRALRPCRSALVRRTRSD